MKVTRETTIEMSTADIKKAVTHYLKDKELISDTADVEIKFDIDKHTEGETMMHPGYEVTELKGCKITVK